MMDVQNELSEPHGLPFKFVPWSGRLLISKFLVFAASPVALLAHRATEDAAHDCAQWLNAVTIVLKDNNCPEKLQRSLKLHRDHRSPNCAKSRK